MPSFFFIDAKVLFYRVLRAPGPNRFLRSLNTISFFLYLPAFRFFLSSPLFFHFCFFLFFIHSRFPPLRFLFPSFFVSTDFILFSAFISFSFSFFLSLCSLLCFWEKNFPPLSKALPFLFFIWCWHLLFTLVDLSCHFSNLDIKRFWGRKWLRGEGLFLYIDRQII